MPLLSLRLLPAAALFLACACSDPDVLATVGRTDIRRADLEHFAAQRSPAARPAPSALMEALVTRELLAEEARRHDLDDAPAVRARLAAAEREVLAQALLEQELARAVDEEVLRQRYNERKAELGRRQVHLRHLMVPLPPDADAEARRAAQARMNLVYARLAGGEDFDAVAREARGTEGFQVQDLGAVREDQVHPAFFAAAAELKEKEFSRPFETPFGLHIVQAVKAPELTVPTFAEVRGQLAADARREAEAQLLKRLRESIRVKSHPERIETRATPGSGATPDAGGTQ